MPSPNGHGSKPERVALYLRVSSEGQRDKETIKTQRAELENYYRLHGLEVVGEYADDGVSDTISLHERPADLTKRLAAKHEECDRYIRLCAQGYITEGELDGYLADLRTQAD
jgi:hypothetical protein